MRHPCGWPGATGESSYLNPLPLQWFLQLADLTGPRPCRIHQSSWVPHQIHRSLTQCQNKKFPWCTTGTPVSQQKPLSTSSIFPLKKKSYYFDRIAHSCSKDKESTTMAKSCGLTDSGHKPAAVNINSIIKDFTYQRKGDGLEESDSDGKNKLKFLSAASQSPVCPPLLLPSQCLTTKVLTRSTSRHQRLKTMQAMPPRHPVQGLTQSLKTFANSLQTTSCQSFFKRWDALQCHGRTLMSMCSGSASTLSTWVWTMLSRKVMC